MAPVVRDDRRVVEGVVVGYLHLRGSVLVHDPDVLVFAHLRDVNDATVRRPGEAVPPFELAAGDLLGAVSDKRTVEGGRPNSRRRVLVRGDDCARVRREAEAGGTVAIEIVGELARLTIWVGDVP